MTTSEGAAVNCTTLHALDNTLSVAASQMDCKGAWHVVSCLTSHTFCSNTSQGVGNILYTLWQSTSLSLLPHVQVRSKMALRLDNEGDEDDDDDDIDTVDALSRAIALVKQANSPFVPWMCCKLYCTLLRFISPPRPGPFSMWSAAKSRLPHWNFFYGFVYNGDHSSNHSSNVLSVSSISSQCANSFIFVNIYPLHFWTGNHKFHLACRCKWTSAKSHKEV